MLRKTSIQLPGHNGCHCVYTLMEQFTNIVVDFEVIVKRDTGGNSTGMEKEALRKLLEGERQPYFHYNNR